MSRFTMSTPIGSAPPPGRDRDVDVLLGSFPPGRLSEIVGPRSSGGSSLLLAVLARATGAGRLVAVVDAADSLDAPSARAAGVDLRLLLWVRCGGEVAPALRAAEVVARCPGFGVVALDLGPGDLPRIPHASLVRLQRAAESGATVLVLRAPRHVAGSTAGLVLSVAPGRASWMGMPRLTRLDGRAACVQVVHARGDSRIAAGFTWSVDLASPESLPAGGAG